MNKNELLKTLNTFNEKVENEEDNKRLIDLFERCYDWINENISTEESVEMKTQLQNSLYQLMYKLVSTLINRNIKCKEISTAWNGRLVRKVYDLTKEKNNKSQLSQLIGEVEQEKDFPTKAYCYQVLQQDGIVDFSKLITSDRQFTTVQRPRIDGGFVEDDGRKYWHIDAKELMTYDECTEKHLSHHLLTYPIGSDKAKLYVGFDEPDKTLIHQTNNEQVEEWVETVMS